MPPPPFEEVFPPWLDVCRVPEAQMAQAYDGATTAQRAALKTAIAFHHCHFGASPALVRTESIQQHAGFWQKQETAHAPWAVLRIADSAPARVLACAMLPILAGVETIAALFCSPPADKALLALELCGIENIFQLAAPQFSDLLNEIHQHAPRPGRLFFLDNSMDEYQLALRMQMSAWHDGKKPRLLLPKPDAARANFIAWLHDTMPETNVATQTAWDCMFVDDKENCGELPPARLTVAPGLEGFWLFANASPAFYLRHSIACGLL